MTNRCLSKETRTIHHEVNGIYGHRRIKPDLAAIEHVHDSSGPSPAPQSRTARSAADFQQSPRTADCPESPGSPARLGSYRSALGLEHDLCVNDLTLVVSGCRAWSLITRLGDHGD